MTLLSRTSPSSPGVDAEGVVAFPDACADAPRYPGAVRAELEGLMSGPVFALVLVAAGLIGAFTGAFLNAVIERVSARTPTLRDDRRAASTLARRRLIALATGAAFVGVTWWGIEEFVPTNGWWTVATIIVAYLYLAAVGIALAIIDLETRRLPNPIVLSSYGVLATLLAAACLFGAPWQALLRAVAGGVVLFAFYALLRLIRPGGMGGGDVKLSGVLGGALGWIGWGALAVGAFAAFLVGGLVGAALLLGRRATRTTAIAFGPFMILGAWIGIVVGGPIAEGYLGLIAVR
ncbi:MAG: A24 family peptidase [Microbacterium sp.]